MPDTPLYGGARADLGATPQPLQPSNVAAQAVQQANQRGAATLDGAFDRFAAIRDFGESQKVEASLRQSQADFDMAMNRALSLAPGSTGSLYDNDGTLDKRALDDLIYDHASKIGELKPQFFNPEAQMRSDAMRQQVGDNLRLRAMGHAATRELQMTKQALQSNLDLCLQAKDYNGFETSIDGGVVSGAMSWADGETAKLKMRHDRSVTQCEDLLYKDPGQLYDLLQNGSFNETLSLAEQDSMMRKLRANAEGNQRDAFLNDFLLTAPDASTSKAKKDATPEFTGMFTERECGWINAIQAGRFGDVEKEIIASAVEEAHSFNPADPGGKEREMAHADYLKKYTAFGMEEKFLERRWKLAEDANAKLQTPTIDTKALLGNLESRGVLINEKDWQWSKNWAGKWSEAYEYDGSIKKGWDKGGALRERYMIQAGIAEDDTGNEAAQKFLKSERRRYMDDISSRIQSQFIQWRESTEEGRNATAFMQHEKIASIARNVTGNPGMKFTNTGDDLDNSVKEARKAQHDKYKEWAKAKGFVRMVDTRTQQQQQEQKPEIVTMGFNRERTDLPEGILLPKSMMDSIAPQSEAEGMVEPGNIDIYNRPVVKNEDGSISTVRSSSFNFDGKEVLLPTVSEDGRILTDEEAVEQYRQTGKHLGIFETPEAATAYAQSLHEGQDSFYHGGLKDSIVEVTYDNKRFRRFRVVGTCEGDTPQMTAAVARKGFYNPNNSYKVNMKIRRGDADSMMKEQDSTNGRPKKLSDYRQTFIDAGQKYGVDPDLLMAIAMHETGNGTSSAFRNKRNAMGVSDAKGPRTFNSVEESIDYMAGQLRRNYLDKGLTDIESIGAKYAPIGAGNDPRGLNGHWAGGVKRNYNQLKNKA